MRTTDELDVPDPRIGTACRELIAENKKITLPENVLPIRQAAADGADGNMR